jgi:hypothetical protein
MSSIRAWANDHCSKTHAWRGMKVWPKMDASSILFMQLLKKIVAFAKNGEGHQVNSKTLLLEGFTAAVNTLPVPFRHLADFSPVPWNPSGNQLHP